MVRDKIGNIEVVFDNQDPRCIRLSQLRPPGYDAARGDLRRNNLYGSAGHNPEA